MTAVHQPYCDVAGCANRHHARGYCSKHYLRWRRDGQPDLWNPERVLLPVDDPPICVCPTPDPNRLVSMFRGECRRCRKPFWPEHAELRAEWRAYLAEVAS